MNIEMSMELYNGKTCSAYFSCHGLDTADGLPVLNGTAVVHAMYVILQGVSQKWCCQIVYTTKLRSLISYCFRVFFVDDVALVCKCLDMFKGLFYIKLVETEHTSR